MDREAAMHEPRKLRVVEPSVLAWLSCSLSPADADGRRRATAELFDKAVRCTWSDDGARVQFEASAEMAQAVLDFVVVERGCCSPLSYRIETEPPHDVIALVMSGPRELRDAIRAWVGVER